MALILPTPFPAKSAPRPGSTKMGHPSLMSKDQGWIFRAMDQGVYGKSPGFVHGFKGQRPYIPWICTMNSFQSMWSLKWVPHVVSCHIYTKLWNVNVLLHNVHTWIFQLCKMCAVSTNKSQPKRQKFSIIWKIQVFTCPNTQCLVNWYQHLEILGGKCIGKLTTHWVFKGWMFDDWFSSGKAADRCTDRHQRCCIDLIAWWLIIMTWKAPGRLVTP